MHNVLQKLLIIMELWKSFLIIKQVENYSHIFQTKLWIRCKTHPLVCTRFRARTATLHTMVKLENHWKSDWNNTIRTAGITLILVRSWIIINLGTDTHLIDLENSCVMYPESHMKNQKIAESLLLSQQQQHSWTVI